jgi:hypothetical protein
MDWRKQESECTHLRARVLSYRLVRSSKLSDRLSPSRRSAGAPIDALRADSCRRGRAGLRSLVFPPATFAFAIRNVGFTSSATFNRSRGMSAAAEPSRLTCLLATSRIDGERTLRSATAYAAADRQPAMVARAASGRSWTTASVPACTAPVLPSSANVSPSSSSVSPLRHRRRSRSMSR